ncbi:MAG TPA: hypothetical protein VLD57_07535, partial [Blastocatellia bacterium]|nr:hypothetical protein [Blastocatellia bacterium]
DNETHHSSLITHHFNGGTMNKKSLKLSIITASVLAMGIAVSAQQKDQPRHPEAKSENGNLVVQLCDGKTQMEVEGVREGEVIPPEMARGVAAKMMAAVKAEQEKQASKWTDRDRMTWEREQKRILAEGDKLFHDWKALGGTIGISCDMCHPNASNTHAETYPKFQTQLKKVAALRDMINWCIENPMKGKPLALDDPRILALEAYMTAERKGVPLAPGKH